MEIRKSRRGRPSKAAIAARDAQRAALLGIDPATIDPRRILAAIAADDTTPAAARVAACRTLLGLGLDTAKADTESERERTIAARAVEMLERRRTLQ